MIIALIYIFLSYVMFDQHLKITLRKSSVPSEKVRFLFFTHPPPPPPTPPPKYSNIENFSALFPPCIAERGEGGEGERTSSQHILTCHTLLHYFIKHTLFNYWSTCLCTIARFYLPNYIPNNNLDLHHSVINLAFPTTFLINQLATVTPSPFSALQFPF